MVAASNAQLALTPTDMATLFDAALANPRWRPQVRAMMYNDYGAYRFNIEGNREEGIRLTQLAATTDPRNAYFEINLTKIALAIGDKALATKHLASAKRLDALGLHDEDIRMLERQLQP
jgi:hypothetical protein